MGEDGRQATRLLNTARSAWMAVAAYLLALLSTQNVVLSAYMGLFRSLGGADALSRWVYALYALAGVAVVGILRPRRASSWTALALTAGFLAYLFAQTGVPANLLHFVQYCPLTLLFFAALGFHCSGRGRYVWTMALITASSVVDEALQSLIPPWDETLPPRRFDPHDLVLNALAAGTVLVLIGFVREDNPPEPGKS